MPKEFPKLIKILEAGTKYSLYALIFLMPVFFLPWTSDVLDFNKQILLLALSFAGLLFWIAKVMLSGEIKLSSNKTHFAVLAFFTAVLASTLFSLDRYGSFWGWPRITSESLLSILCLAVVYFLASNIFSKKEVFVSLALLGISGALAFLLGIFQLSGLFLPFGFAKSASFNTLGLVGSLGIFAAVLLPLLTAMEMQAGKWLKIIFAAAIALDTICLVIINYLLVWWIALAGCVMLMIFAIMKKGLFDLRWLGIPMFFIVLSLFFIILPVSLPVASRPLEIHLNQKSGLDIALKTLAEWPVLGSGPGTFAFDFSRFRDASLNSGALWNLRFDNGGSQAITILATTGILGFFAFLAIVFAAIFYGIKFLFKTDSIIAGGILVSLFSQIIAFFFYPFNLSLEFVFFFLLGCFICLYSQKRRQYLLKPSSFLTLGVTFLFTLFFIFGFGILILSGQRYIAEINYAKGISAYVYGKNDEALKSLEKAVSMNPKSDVYLAQLSQAYLAKLSSTLNDSALSDSEKNQASQILVSNAINSAKMATDLSSSNVNNWSVRGYIYQNLVGLVSDSETWALDSYSKASELEPQSPYYPTQKAIVYLSKAGIVNKNDASKKDEDLNSAKAELDKAIDLKSDYAPARFQMAMVYQAKGETSAQIKALEEAKKYSPNDIGLLFQIGLVYYQQGVYEKTVSNLESALRLSPNYANAMYFLGLSYDKLGEKTKALEQFRKISSLNPDNEDIKKIITNLESGKTPLAGISQQDPPQAPIEEEKTPQ